MYLSKSSVIGSLMQCAETGLVTLHHVWCSVCFTPLSGGAGSRLLCCLDASSVTACNNTDGSFYRVFARQFKTTSQDEC